VVRPQLGSVAPGDIVCYPGPGHVIAHRVQRIEQSARGPVFVTRGDAMLEEEQVEERACAYVVRRVEHRYFAYATGGLLGRAAASCALRGGMPFRVAHRLGELAASVLRRCPPSAGARAARGAVLREVQMATLPPSAAQPDSSPAEGKAAPTPERDAAFQSASAARRPSNTNALDPSSSGAPTHAPGSIGAPTNAPGSSGAPTMQPSRRGSVAAPSSGTWSSSDSLLRLLNHELRTPLNGILGFLEILLGELDGPLISDEREHLALVRDAGRQLLSRVGELLDLVAAVASDAEGLPQSVDLAALLEGEGTVLEERRGVRPVHVRVDVAPDAGFAWVDRAQLVRVLRVLGELAIDVTVSGEVALEVYALPGERGILSIGLRVRADGQLFTPPVPGERVSSANVREERVRRLKLQMAERLAERELGRLELEVQESGSQLSLILPRDQPESTRDRPEVQARPPASPSAQVAAAGQLAAAVDQGDIPLAVRYLAASGHDLRTPLNAILGFSDLVAMHDHARWTESQHKSLSIVRERARDLAAMVDDMIDWAKLEVGDLHLSPAPHPARQLIERAAASAIEHSGARGLRVDLTFVNELGSVRVDADRFVQALVGLMEHAARAAPAPAVQLRAERLPDGLTLQVVDPGLEVRHEDRAHIFAAFRPSFAPTGQRIAGLHLGTSVARALFRAHGGDVWFESRPGQGTRFVASLPEACLA
jgi:signal transduction histidine kinase